MELYLHFAVRLHGGFKHGGRFTFVREVVGQTNSSHKMFFSKVVDKDDMFIPIFLGSIHMTQLLLVSKRGRSNCRPFVRIYG